MEWKFKENAEPQGSSDGFWYDLTYGGYIDLCDLLADADQLKQADEAVGLLSDLEESLKDAGLLKEF